ncbi:transporter [Allosphingosinicella sp.]|uniref:transporter n=1 Tax=Allosphingosinicella sp. TaxID=2823234 RepID=UPI003784866E
MKARHVLAAIFALWPSAAFAGPPFLTDDPEPTDTGHWEIYAPLFEAEGSGRDFEGSLGAEINYGAAANVQVTIGLPAAYSHDASGWHWGAGDFEASVKYRFYHDESAGVQVAFFPGLTLPTASQGLGAGHVTALLPVWAQKDFGPWSVFGGGGYAINPGAGNRDYLTGGIALTRRFGERLLVGIEADRQGADVIGGRASTSLGVGVIYDLPGPFRLLASGGPTFEDGGRSGFHSFVALGLDF